MKRYTIFAGVNGAGKSTFYREAYHPLLNEHRINTDEMVARLGTWKDEELQVQCARVAIGLIKGYFATGESFNQETTLSGKTIVRNIKRAKELGYEVHLYYVGLNSVEIALERIKKRVRLGGHGIPEERVRNRYESSFANLKDVFKYCDRIAIYDNSEKMRLVAKFNKGNLEFKSKKIPAWLKNNKSFEKLVNFYF
jgi:predicted ABC-type ATPase